MTLLESLGGTIEKEGLLISLACLFRSLQSPPGSLSKGEKEDKEEVWQKCETSLFLRYKSNLILCRASSKDEVRVSFSP